MPLPLPNLDDRRWADLVEEGRAQITRYSPQWTDHNLHDPGITLIDLYAWLAEMTAYRLNRISSRHKRKFVQLLGFVPFEPSPARVMLSFAPASGTPVFTLPAGVEFEGTNAELQAVAFRTARDLTVSVSVLQALQVDVGDGSLTDRTADYRDGFPIEPFGPNPVPGSALYLGFDPLEKSAVVSLGFRLEGPGNDDTERRRILEEAGEQSAACRPTRTRFRCVPDPAAPRPQLPPHHSVRLVWEVFDGSGWAGIVPASDDTRSLTLDGYVELSVPSAAALSQQGSVSQQLFYLRCRVAEGAFDAVPVLLDLAVNAVEAEQSVPATQGFVVKRGTSPAGTAPVAGGETRIVFAVDARGVITSLDFSASSGPLVTVWAYSAPTASADGSLVLGLRVAGVGSGFPDQQFELPQSPLVNPDVWTLTGTEWQQWVRRQDFDASSRTDYDYVLDPTIGLLTFGSGEGGRVPEAGSLVIAFFRQTAADAGNLGAGAVDRVRQSPVNTVLLSGIPAAVRTQLAQMVGNRAPASNGQAAEPLEHAEGRAVEVLHAHERLVELAERFHSATLDEIAPAEVRALIAPHRGVNLLDLERLATSVPGTRVARARAWRSLHPVYPCLQAPGVITVVIVPEAPAAKPQPSAGLLDMVWRYLDRRRMLTTTLQIAGPQYVEVTVTATIHLVAGASAAKVPDRVVAALNAFIDPLHGGPSAIGWPFGRSVFRTEILQLIDGIPGVDHVVSMSMTADSGPQQCGDLALCPMALAFSGSHSIEVI